MDLSFTSAIPKGRRRSNIPLSTRTCTNIPGLEYAAISGQSSSRRNTSSLTCSFIITEASTAILGKAITTTDIILQCQRIYKTTLLHKGQDTQYLPSCIKGCEAGDTMLNCCAANLKAVFC